MYANKLGASKSTPSITRFLDPVMIVEKTLNTDVSINIVRPKNRGKKMKVEVGF